MSRISSNSFFHFTKKENLIGILQNNFYPRYCEEYTCTSDGSNFKMAFPIISFCDIPLSQIHNHINNYGRYGIGLSKDWIIKNKLNPIIYIHNNSSLLMKLESIMNSNFETLKVVPIQQVLEDRNSLIYLMMYTKPYEGIQIRDGIKNNIRFYDEREWRFIPDIKKIDKEELHLIPQNYTKQQIEDKNNILKKYPLKFEPNDIKYIIIEKEDDRASMINSIVQIKSSKNYSPEDIKLLTSKIVSVEQINGDF